MHTNPNKFNALIYFLLIGFLIFLSSCNPKISGYISEASPKSYHLKTLRNISSELNESSGLCFFDNEFWSLNDSGDGNFLYSFGTHKNDSIRKITIEGSVNHDWESLDDDSMYVYIADVGDNFGNRNNLFIYRVLKTNIRNGIAAGCDTIQLSFPEKSVIPNSTSWSSWDCESIAVIDDSIYLFTKNWNEYTTSVYAIPAKPGNYTSPARSVAKVNMLVTGADFEPCSGRLFLIGYMKYRPVMVIFPSFNNGYLSGQAFTRLGFRGRFGTQTEAVTATCNGNIFISSERSIYPPRLFQLIPKE